MTNVISSYEKALEILTSQGKFYINLGLDRVKALLELYDNPQDKIKCVHVAGTNGKGSTCAMLSSVLTKAGYKTGLYTSPHLINYTERVKINGQDISREDFADLIFDITKTADENNIHATEFEILTVLAFIFFERKKINAAIIETGLGGRFDATNVIKKPLLSIITTIDLDHVDRLGNTIEKIACEKAGIIKQNTPVITLKNNKGLEILKEKAINCGSDLILAEETNCPADMNLKGLWQKKNLSIALKALEQLCHLGFAMTETDIAEGLKNVSWPARFQYLKEMDLILDGAHNPNAAKLLAESLDYYYPEKKRIWIYSSINTKNYEEVMEILFRPTDTIILTQANIKSSVPSHVLKDKFIQKNIKDKYKIHITKNIKEAINVYSGLKTSQIIGIAAGSLYSAGEFLEE